MYIYFHGAGEHWQLIIGELGEQAYTFGDLGRTAIKLRKTNSGIWGDQSIIFRDQESTGPTPVWASAMFYHYLSMAIYTKLAMFNH